MARQPIISPVFAIPMLFCLLALPAAGPASAGWAPFGSPASLADSNQVLPKSLPDGLGGIFIAWEDYRNGDADVYAQHLDPSGTPLWGANGAPVIVHAGNQESPVLAHDGSGGIIVAWQDTRSGVYDIYAQSLDANGAPRWTSSGVGICTETGIQVLQVATEDASGGAIIGWRDLRNGNGDIFAQRVDHGGSPLWISNGVAVCDTTGTQSDVKIVADQQGGAYLLWRDRRSGIFSTDDDLYAQRLNANGVVQWTKNGILVTGAPGSQNSATLIGDGRYGFIATWLDQRGPSDDIYAQRILPNGTPKWSANGVVVTGATGTQGAPIITAAGDAGALIAWTDSRSSARPDIYAQSVDSVGVRKWAPADGVAVCATDSSQAAATIVSNGLGGAIIGWDDDRAGFREIFAQHIDAGGNLLWAPLGLKIGTGAGQRNLSTASSDGYGGCLFAWTDFRGGPNSDIYANRVIAVGTGVEAPAAPAATARLFPARPNPFNPHTTLSYQLDRPGTVRLALFDLHGRLVRELVRGDRPAGRHEVVWDGLDRHGLGCASGVYFVQLSASGVRQKTAVTLLR
jgi:hypothetical protein